MNCELLANTGENAYRLTLISILVIVITITFLLIIRSKARSKRFIGGMLVIIGFIFLGGLSLTPKSTYALSSQCTSSSVITPTPSDKPSLVLNNDTYNQDNFTQDPETQSWNGLFNIIGNDQAQANDPIDPSTIRLSSMSNQLSPDGSVGVSGLDFNIYSPNDIDHIDLPIGRIYLDGLSTPATVPIDFSGFTGKVHVELYPQKDGSMPISNDLVLKYTVKTIHGTEATSPATITINMPLVQLGYITVCPNVLNTINLLDYVHVNKGTLDTNTIDLDPSTPGIQTTNTYKVGGDSSSGDVISVDSNGILTISQDSYHDSLVDHKFQWTISNNLGYVSGIGTIDLNFDACPTP